MDPFDVGVIALLIPIVALLIPIFALYFAYKKERVKREERMKAIEQGADIPPEPTKEPLKPMDYLRRGLISLAVGVGLVVGSLFTQGIEDSEFFVLAGIIVFLVGVALVIYYKFQRGVQ